MRDFIDELPWLDTPRANFLSAFEHFWNDWGSGRHNLLLVVCGSATSWMLDNLINNKGAEYRCAVLRGEWFLADGV